MYARWYRRTRKVDGEVRSAKSLTVAFRDPDGGEHQLSSFTDEAVTKEFCWNLNRLIGCRVSGVSLDAELIAWVERLSKDVRGDLAAAGILNAARAEGARALMDQVQDFKASLMAKGDTTKHAALTSKRAAAVIAGCPFGTWTDISPSRLQGYLAEQRAKSPESRKGIKTGTRRIAQGVPPGIGMQTANYYLAAFKAFCRWAVREGRVTDNPVAHLSGVNARVDRQTERRALSTDECRRLLAATAASNRTVYGMRGTDRTMLYRLALSTGLRWSELRSLTAQSFTLDADPATVTVEAGYSKHRRQDTLPLRPDTAGALKSYLAGSAAGARVLPMPASDKGAKILRVDLRAAKKAWIIEAKGNIPEVKRRFKSDFLSPTDASGRVVDFHGLRHSFISALTESGAHPKMAQSLARHSTIGLTMDRYTHLTVASQSDALAALPDLSTPAADAEAVRATGTDDVQAVNAPVSGPVIDWNLTSQASETGRTGADGSIAPKSEPQEPLENQGIPNCNGGRRGIRTHDPRIKNPLPFAEKPCKFEISEGHGLEMDSGELREVATAWPNLPEPIKAGILAMVRSLTPKTRK